jgi:hypothetical protein
MVSILQEIYMGMLQFVTLLRAQDVMGRPAAAAGPVCAALSAVKLVKLSCAR